MSVHTACQRVQCMPCAGLGCLYQCCVVLMGRGHRWHEREGQQATAVRVCVLALPTIHIAAAGHPFSSGLAISCRHSIDGRCGLKRPGIQRGRAVRFRSESRVMYFPGWSRDSDTIGRPQFFSSVFSLLCFSLGWRGVSLAYLCCCLSAFCSPHPPSPSLPHLRILRCTIHYHHYTCLSPQIVYRSYLAAVSPRSSSCPGGAWAG